MLLRTQRTPFHPSTHIPHQPHFMHCFLQETGPTNVGDEYSDAALMIYLGARKTTMLGNNL